MTRRRVLLLGSLVVVTALVLAWVVWPRPSAINAENAERIQAGMTRAEVETILGGPWHRESSIVGQGDWIGPGYVITVQFSDDDRVVFRLAQQKVWRDSAGVPHVAEETLLQRIRHRVGL